MTNIEETMEHDHLSIAHECNRQLRAEIAALPKTIADTFRECYSSSYLRGDEVAQIIERRFGLGVSYPRSKAE